MDWWWLTQCLFQIQKQNTFEYIVKYRRLKRYRHVNVAESRTSHLRRQSMRTAMMFTRNASMKWQQIQKTRCQPQNNQYTTMTHTYQYIRSYRLNIKFFLHKYSPATMITMFGRISCEFAFATRSSGNAKSSTGNHECVMVQPNRSTVIIQLILLHYCIIIKHTKRHAQWTKTWFKELFGLADT